PLIFVCENNGFAEFTPRSAHTKVERVSDVVAPYEFERRTVDGGDVEEVYDAFGAFLDAARGRRGPFLLECLTHRRRGHYEGDSQSYRDEVAEAEWAELDPIARLQTAAVQRGWMADEDAAALQTEARAEVEAAVAFARSSAELDPRDAARLVYAGANGEGQ